MKLYIFSEKLNLSIWGKLSVEKDELVSYPLGRVIFSPELSKFHFVAVYIITSNQDSTQLAGTS